MEQHQKIRIVIKRAREFPGNCTAYISTKEDDSVLDSIVHECKVDPDSWEVFDFSVNSIASLSGIWLMNARDTL